MVIRDPYEKSERNRQIYSDRLSGLTYQAIGNKYGIGAERARQIYLREVRREKNLNYRYRRTTLRTLDDLKRARDRYSNFTDARACSYRSNLSNETKETIQELIQKIDNLIEVYGENC